MQQKLVKPQASAPIERPAVARIIRVTSLFRASGIYRRECRVPFIRMSGKWLAALGFQSNSQVVVHAQPGQLTITVLSRNLLPSSKAG